MRCFAGFPIRERNSGRRENEIPPASPCGSLAYVYTVIFQLGYCILYRATHKGISDTSANAKHGSPTFSRLPCH